MRRWKNHGKEAVRLVRACGSKPVEFLEGTTAAGGQARKSLWIETLTPISGYKELGGQARKSLWIETVAVYRSSVYKQGQARKSLWIETRNIARFVVPGYRSGS